MIISTNNIYNSIHEYKKLGYEMIDVPYIVEEDISKHTIRTPKDTKDLYYKDRVYVASAEQSFVALYKKGLLKNNKKYMALTPCYRTEDVLDELHYNLFIKLELIYVGSDNTANICNDAKNVLSKLVPIKKLYTKQGIDLYSYDVEIGSYGAGYFMDGCVYTYGTGYTDPRMSICIEKMNKGK